VDPFFAHMTPRFGVPPGKMLSVMQNENPNCWSVKQVKHFSSLGKDLNLFDCGIGNVFLM
jgi:hypothetical protein